MGVLSWLFKKDEDKVQPVMAGIPGVQNVIANTIGSAISQTLKGNAVSNLKGNLQALSNPVTADQWSKGFDYSPTGVAQNFVTSWYGKPLAQLPGNIKQTAQGIQEGDWLKAGEGAGKTALGILGAIPDPTDLPIAGYNAVKGFSAGMQDKNRTPQSVVKRTVDALTFNDPVGAGTAFLKPQYGKLGEDVGNLAELPALLAVGAVRSKGEARNIKSAQELASTVAKNMGKKAGEGVTLPLRTLLKSFNLTDDMLESLDKGTLNGRGFSIQKLGNQVEFIFDDGFKPSGIKVAPRVEPKVKVKTPQVVAPAVQDVAPKAGSSDFRIIPGETAEQTIARVKGKPLASGGMDEVWNKLRPSLKMEFDEALTQRNRKEVARLLPEIPDTYKQTWKTQIDDVLEPKLLVGDTKPVSPRDAIRIGKKTGEAVPFVNELPAGTKPIILPEAGVPLTIPKPNALQDRALGGGYFDLRQADLGDIRGGVAGATKGIERVIEDKGLTKGNPQVQDYLQRELVDFNIQKNTDFANDKRLYQDEARKILSGLDEASVKETLFKYGTNPNKDEALQQLQQTNPNNWQSVVEADKNLRILYDKIHYLANEMSVKLGRGELPYEPNYYRRILESADDMAQQTATSAVTGSVPNIKDFGALKARTTDKAKYKTNVAEGLQNYIDGMLGFIHFSPVIEKRKAIAQIVSQTSPNFAKWLNTSAEIMAGTYEAPLEQVMRFIGKAGGGDGQAFMNVAGGAQKNIGKNLVTSVTVALSQTGTAPLVVAEVGLPQYLRSAKRVLVDHIFTPDFKLDGQQSTFANSRYLDEPIFRGTWDKIFSTLSKPGQFIDEVSTKIAIDARYQKNLRAGMDTATAFQDANAWTSRMVANRSAGMMPPIMQQAQPLSMFGLEPINYFYYLSDEFRRYGAQNATAGAIQIGKIFASIYVYNSIYQHFLGRRLHTDPINMIVSGVQELASSDDIDDKTKKVFRIVMDEVPIFGRSKIPIQAGVQTLPDFQDDWLRASIKVGMYLNPAGGFSQVAKTMEGVENYIQGYDEVKAGDRIRFMIEQSPLNLFRSIVAGAYAIPEATEFYDKGYSALGDKESNMLKNLQSKSREDADAVGYTGALGNDVAVQVYNQIRETQEGKKFEARIGVLKQKALNIIQDPKSTPEDIKQAGIDFEKGVQAIAQDLQKYAEKNKSRLQPQTPQIKGATSPRIDRTIPQATTTADQATLKAYQSMPKPQGKGASIKVGSIKKLPKLKLPSLSTTSTKDTPSSSYQGVKIKPLTIPKQPRLRARG